MTRQWIMILGAMLLFSILAVGQTSKLSKERKNLSANEYLRVRLDAPVRNYSLTARNFLEALTTVAGNFEIPMGVVWMVTPAKAEFNFSWNSGTVEQVINKIVKSQPGYEIQIRNGVLHVLAPGLIPDRQNFLKLVIPHFLCPHEYIETANDKLYRMVYSMIFPRSRIPGGILVGARADEPKIDLDLHERTVDQILDEFVVNSKRKIWIVAFSSDTLTTETGFRSTASLSPSKSSPDDEHTITNLFHFDKLAWLLINWGDALPQAILRTN